MVNRAKLAVSILLGLLFSVFAASCGKGPSAPGRVQNATLGVNISLGSPAGPGALAAVSNPRILYRVDGPGMPQPLRGELSLANPELLGVLQGTGNFVVDIPGGGPRVLSVQINDLATGNPMLLGAAGIDLTQALPANDLVVEMGSVTRNCYTTSMGVTANFGGSYNFSTDVRTAPLAYGPTQDLAVRWISIGTNFFYLSDASAAVAVNKVVAYLGNGDLVDFPEVPPQDSFVASSYLAKGSGLQAGDVYCLKLTTMPGHAWIQIVNPGTVFGTGPVFRFRVNRTKPFYAYDRTQADTNATCNLAY